MSKYGIDWSKGLENFSDEDYDTILTETTKIIEARKPDELLAGAYYDRGVVHRYRGDEEKAIADYTSDIQLHCPHIAAAYYNRAVVYYDMDQYDAALADFNVYLRYKPNDPNDKKLRNAITWMLEHQ